MQNQKKGDNKIMSNQKNIIELSPEEEKNVLKTLDERKKAIENGTAKIISHEEFKRFINAKLKEYDEFDKQRNLQTV